MWKEVDTIVYYLHPEFKHMPTVAVFNFLGTILKFKSTTKKIKYYTNVREKLLDIANKGASIIFCQSFQQSDLGHIKLLFEEVLKDTQIPIMAFFSTKLNKYMKPFTNMWRIIELSYFKRNKTINKTVSIYVGHHAGRIKSYMGKYKLMVKKIDSKATDRAFASNIGLTFFTPEIFFQEDKNPITWSYGEDVINNTERKSLMDPTFQNPVVIEEIQKLPTSTKYMVLITGPPSSGKTTLAEKIKRKWELDYKLGNVVHITENDYDEEDEPNIVNITNDIVNGNNNSDKIDEIDNEDDKGDEILKKIKEEFKKDNSIILDVTQYSQRIQEIVSVSTNASIPVLIIEIKIDKELSTLLNFIKIQQSKDAKETLYRPIVWYTYKKHYTILEYDDAEMVNHVYYHINVIASDEYWLAYCR